MREPEWRIQRNLKSTRNVAARLRWSLSATRQHKMHEGTYDFSLPPDLLAFLREGRQLTYDASDCEAGLVSIRSLEELCIQLFPMETSSLDNFADDPNHPNLHSYLVPAVDLVRSCSGDYEPTGLLLWLPEEDRYGTWDSSHCFINQFSAETDWATISNAPSPHINAQWTGMDPESPPVQPLLPWFRYEYADRQYYRPLDVD